MGKDIGDFITRPTQGGGAAGAAGLRSALQVVWRERYFWACFLGPERTARARGDRADPDGQEARGGFVRLRWLGAFDAPARSARAAPAMVRPRSCLSRAGRARAAEPPPADVARRRRPGRACAGALHGGPGRGDAAPRRPWRARGGASWRVRAPPAPRRPWRARCVAGPGGAAPAPRGPGGARTAVCRRPRGWTRSAQRLNG